MTILWSAAVRRHLLPFTSVLKYLRPVSAISVTALAPGPSRLAHLDRGGDAGSGRRAAEEAFLPRKPPRHRFRRPLRSAGSPRPDSAPTAGGCSRCFGLDDDVRMPGWCRFSTVAIPREEAAVISSPSGW